MHNTQRILIEGVRYDSATVAEEPNVLARYYNVIKEFLLLTIKND